MKPRLGCLTLPGILTVIISTLFFGGITVIKGGVLFSPGSLNADMSTQTLGGVRSHGELSSTCSACHPAPWNSHSMSDRCAVCHTDVTQNPQNFHRLIFNAGSKCRDCHTEHRGKTGFLTTLDPAKFPHEQLRFSLKAHQQKIDGSLFICSDCHIEEISLFDQQVCVLCHVGLDPQYLETHISAFGYSCLDCHDGIDRYHEFDHNQLSFTLNGKHERIDCVGCHKSASNVNELRSTLPHCFSCHQSDDPHQLQAGAKCQICHTPDGWDSVTYDHTQNRFPLLGKHTNISCRSCHIDLKFIDTSMDCVVCHAKDDNHAGQLGVDCGACHTSDGWDQSQFNHAQSTFPLTGNHLNVQCVLCHPGNVYKGTPQDCYSCHRDDDFHQGEYGKSCNICHDPNGWLPVNFDHTNFPLVGGHSNVKCIDCHSEGQFGKILSSCFSCHSEPTYHLGLLGMACEQCHNTLAWTPAVFYQPHRFPLDHGGSNNTCISCHPTLLSQYTCYTCHDQNEVREEHLDEGISNFRNCMNCHPDGLEGDD